MPDDLERRIARAIAAPVHVGPHETHAVMERVRRAAALGSRPRRGRAPWRRGARQSFIGLALAAGVGGISTLSAVAPSRDVAGGGASVVVLGDTVVSTLRDTLRLVRLMLDAPAARSVSIAGDFNAWGERPLPLHRDPVSRRWAVTLALRDGEHRYAFVVDGTRWVADPSSERSRRDHAGRPYSLLNVARAAN